MKKTSTTTIGIDLGDEYSQVCILDDQGNVIEEGRMRTREEDFFRRFNGIESALFILEAGTHSPWLSRLLQGLGHECLVANPASLHRPGRKKSDRIDAEKLARWGRSDRDLLEPVYHGSADIQADMAIVHSRRALVEIRTKLINRCRGLVKSWGERLPRCDADYFATRVSPYVPSQLAPAIEPLLQTIALLTTQIKAFEDQIKSLAATKYGQATGAIGQIKGVGPITSVTFVLTLRDPQRFRQSRRVGPYLGLTPRQDQSSESDREHSISKAGNTYMRRLLVQCAHSVIERGPDSDLKRWGLAKSQGSKRAQRRAVVAVARKLAVLMHHLWLTGDVYEPLRQREVTPSLPTA